MSNTSGPRTILLAAVRLAVLLFSLAAIRMFIGLIPSFRSVALGSSGVSVFDALGAVLSAIGISLTIFFARESEPVVTAAIPRIPGAGRLAKFVLYIFCAAYGFHAFQKAAVPFLHGVEWLYPSLFMSIVVGLCLAIAVHIYKTSDAIALSLLGVLQPAMPEVELGTANCARCDSPNREGTKFCKSCGTALTAQPPPKCARCSTELDDDSNFCSGCGEKIAHGHGR